MANDLSAKIKTEIGNTVAELQKTSTAIQKVAAANDQAGRAAKESTGHHATVGKAMKEAGEHAEGMGEKFIQAMQALRLFGGEAGQLATHLEHTAHRSGTLEGGLGKLALAAGAAGIAFEVYNSILERNQKLIEDAIEAEEKHRAVIEAGEKAEQSKATAARSKEELATKLITAGGEGALEEAEKASKTKGIPFNDALKGYGDLYNMKPRDREAALKIGNDVFAGGGNFAQAIVLPKLISDSMT